MAYRLKTVKYKEKNYQILLQNENGPCPLLAAANVLLLKQSITLPPYSKSAGVVTIEELTNVLAEKILLNHEEANNDHHINEVMKIFPNLQFGMDVNPKFTAGPTGVEYTMELNAFDLLSIELVHGWLLEPDAQEYEWVGNNTYNQLVNLVIEGNDASAVLQENPNVENHDELSNQATRGSVLHHFLERSAHQLTQYGLQVLHEYVKEGNMVVFFRNNHFNTLTKHEGHLYLLVTDFGYADVSSVVWEKLDVIDGDTEYVDGSFKVLPPVEHHISSAATGEQMIANNLQSNSDYQLALQLSRESEAGATAAAATPSIAPATTTSPNSQRKLSNHDLEIEKAMQANLLDHEQHQQLLQKLQYQDNTTDERSTLSTPADKPSTTPTPTNTAPATPNASSQPTIASMPQNLAPNVEVGVPLPPISQEERDRMLALQLQKQEEQERLASTNLSSDEELARAIQQQENARQRQYAARQTPVRPAAARAMQPQRARVGAGAGSKDNGCIIS
ncbi:MindY deubiquitinase [Nitzschia inconspicua]|uniref:MindY deubiquitinase n=1 Tax=Nitzschia inconspicua TaxID=303405 RepID=A0A9K3PPR4_9STRA|nr:MindY deubiquitinase [Nitzschia inconspicua]